jgi:uncharacterized coiled-coil protein SlyX
VVVTLADGRRGVVLRWMCEGLEVDANGQVRRLRRSPTTKGEVWPVRVDTESGRQTMPTLNYKGVAFWLASINPLNFDEGPRRDNIIRYQLECMEVLHEHFEKKASASRAVVPSEVLPQPSTPAPGASAEIWIAYHEQMAEWYRWQRDVEVYRARTDAAIAEHGEALTDLQQRMARQEELTAALPEVLAAYRYRPLSDEHRATIKAMIHRLADLTGKTLNGLWLDLNTMFHVAEYKRIPDAQYQDVRRWLLARIHAAGGKTDDLENEQSSLF